jgi:hypothetical protein
MRSCLSARVRRAVALAGVAAILCSTAVRAADTSEPIAVVSLDPYADLKSQLTWMGEQVGNPTLAGFAESFILLATQGKGLAGLDVKRPVGIVVTTAGGPLPTAHAFVPVKDLAKLLGALQGMTGPVEEVDGVQRISPPGAPPFDIAEKDDWAILSQPGSPMELKDALELIEPLSKDYSLAIEFFPSRMPAEMRKGLEAMLDEAARNAAAQGQPMDDAALRAGLENLEDVERLVFGLAIDKEQENVHLDVTSVIKPESDLAAMWKDDGRATGTVAAPATSDGKAAALRGHYVATVPAGGDAAVRAAFDKALESADGDPTAGVVAGVLRDAVAAMLETGAIDAGFTVDTSAADGDSPIPAVTIGMKVKDGAALEKQVKERLGKPDALPPGVTVAFDKGRHAGATLHEISLDTAGIPGGERLGKNVTVTLAVGPQQVHLLAGGDVKKRLDEAAAAAGKPVADAKPIAGLDASLAAIVGYAARMAQAFQPDDPQGEALGEVAAQAAEKKSTQVQLSMKPIDRGMTIRFLVDAGAIQTVAASTSVQQGGPAPRAVPAMPLRPAQPRPLEKAAPAIAP